MEFVQDACDTADGLKQGDQVEIRYRLNGRKWQKDAKSEVKYFLNAEALGFKVLSQSAAANNTNAPAADEEPPVYEDNSDDIPF